ncbi:glycosyltransferase [Brumicola nitratireducens]|uniref:Glycosyltransferase n=1 Tax=Glaciecola nitratireducens (strain JCM 12485 / KCTC 12276 / FR1064) TaxID=1085623 RepID=G4QI45_GLANF|nr:glycosyltransferase [Glaciecola nitratireducens]AEP30659.1 glycosyltransferase [Glaciecola nitratireducens FR1064]
MKIKLMHLVYSFDVGGLERIIANCIASLPDNYEHTIVTLTNYSEEFVAQLAKSVKMIALNKPQGQSWGTFKQFYAVLKQEKPDILHSYNLASLEFQTMAALARVPFRLHAEHGRDVHDPDGTNKKYQILRKLVAPFVHKIVSVSDDLHQWLINVVGLSDKKCDLILNGVDTAQYKPAERHTGAAVSEGSTAAQALIFGHVGRLQAIKNQKNLIASYVLACEQSEKFKAETKLVVVGKGPLQEALEQQIANSSCPQNIEMWGERHDMPAVYQALNVFVMSSDAEGVPMTMLEAMSSGLPVVSTRVGGIPEITSKEQAILVDAKSVEALSEGLLLMFDKYKAEGEYGPVFQEMQAASQQLVEERFSQNTMINQYLALYQQGLAHVRN